jgi:hypothetical protein
LLNEHKDFFCVLRHIFTAPGFLQWVINTFFLSEEDNMGNSLHHKIYLGRRTTVLGSTPLQVTLVIAGFAIIGLAWLAIRSLP